MLSRIIDSNRGGINYVSAILLLIVAVAIFFGLTVAPKWMADYNLRQQLHLKMVNAANLADYEIRSQVVKYAEEKGIPLNLNEFSCSRIRDTIHCRYEYKWPVSVGGIELFALTFSFDKEREITEVFGKLTQP